MINNDNPKKIIKSLCDEINRHNKLYYVDAKPQISDRDFDSLMTKLEAFEKKFPQFKLKNGKNLDEKFSSKPIVIISPKLKKKISNKINYVLSNNVNGLSEYLNNIKSEGLIVRPDRFIIGSITVSYTHLRAHET